MQTKKILGFIISKSPYLDNDEILNVYGENSIIKVYAKGVKKIESKNRSNVIVGSLVDFEILENYSKNDWFFLKKATTIKSLPDINKNNSDKIETLVKILRKMRNFSNDVFNTYNFLLNNLESENFYKIQTFLVSRILESNGEGLSFQNCVICSTNQQLYSFDVMQGGMLCKKHGEHSTPLDLLKSLYSIGESIEKYIKTTNPETNKKIFNILISLLN
ncbi:MAG: DNA repair protein RecO [Metamycoplasmataceae bacterium]